MLILLTMAATYTMTAQERKLPAPSFIGGMPMNEAVANRHSTREFDASREIDDTALSQLLWMGVGINRPDAKESRFGAPANRSNPTARNWQEIHAYVFDRNGVWEYLPESHSLKPVKEGDHRQLIAGTKEFSQEFVLEAPVSILFVANLTNLPEDPQVSAMACVDAGIACENLNLACVSEGLATVPRATMDHQGIVKLLGLSERQLPLMNNPIGYAK